MSLRARPMWWYQRTALRFAYVWYGFVLRRNKHRAVSWVVGTDEIASLVQQISQAVPDSFSVSMYTHPLYENTYDYSLGTRNGSQREYFTRVLKGPWILARLMHQARGFIYVGPTGFLLDNFDHRDFEFGFIKRHGLSLVCYWTGSDIRSLPRMKELETTLGVPNIATYIPLVVPGIDSPATEERRRQFAEVSDRWADALFNFESDQRSHLTRVPEPIMFYLNMPEPVSLDKHDDRRPVAVHATTSPIIKGTQLVRAAVEKLHREGYDFEYVELMGVPNDVVRSELARAHIALNQFYGFTPTVFGFEAMIAGTAVMMSSGRDVEPGIPEGADDAWLQTRHWEVYDHLKRLLDHPEERRETARRGQQWAHAHGSIDGNAPRLQSILEAVENGTYRDPAVYGERFNNA